MWEGSVDMVVSLCAPLVMIVLAQGTGFIGPTRSLPFEGTSVHL